VPIDLTTYRDRLERMTAEALEEYYGHSAGLKPTMEMARVYERYADMTTLEVAGELAAMDAPLELQRFAGESFVGNGCRDLTDAVANLEAVATVEFDGEQIPYRAVRPRLLNEPDHSRRRELHERRCEVTERDMNPLLRDVAERERELTARLGADSVLDLYTRFGYRPRELHAKTEAFLEQTEALYLAELERALRARVGIDLDQAGPADINRLMRAPEFDPGFPAVRALPALRATLLELGIDLDRQRNVELDIAPRDGKRPRAFCAPIRVPGRVVLVVLPQGGQDDYNALFHEAGHTEHFAHVNPSLPAEHRVLGDNAVTEGFAFLLEHLVSDPGWLSAQLDFPRAEEYIRFSAFTKLLFLRRYAAKLAYELELHSGKPLDELPRRYTQLLSAAVGVACPESDFLEDVDGGFYCTCYLRAWALEAQLAGWLRGEYGAEWFRQRPAGVLVRELWELGQSLDADALLHQVTGETIDFEVLVDEARRALS
jgi:hypothetical protein